MKCSKCGADIDDSNRFCPVCGIRLNDNDEEIKKTTYESKDTREDEPNISPHFVEARIARKISGRNKSKDKKPIKKDFKDEIISKDKIVIENIINDKSEDDHKLYHKKRDDLKKEEIGDIDLKPKAFAQQSFKDDEVKKDDVNKKGEGLKPKKNNIKSIIGVIIALLLALLLIYYFFNKNKVDDVSIDLKNYINVTFEGEEGSGIPIANIRKDSLINDYKDKVIYKNKKIKNEVYPDAISQFADELEKNTTFQYSKDGNLYSGEELNVVANISDSQFTKDYNVILNERIKSVIVDDLKKITKTDPFNYLNIIFEGSSPDIKLSTTLKDNAPPYMSDVQIMANKTAGLMIGDEVNVSLSYDRDKLLNQYNVRFSSNDKTYKVNKEGKADISGSLDSNFIKTTDELNDEFLGKLKANAGNIIKDSFDLRDYTQIQSIDYLGSITGYNQNLDDGIKNKVFLIYSMTVNEDYEGLYQSPFTYFTFVEYRNVKDSYDKDSKFYGEGPFLSDHEVYHKFFVDEDYTYYEIAYYGFGYLEEVLDDIDENLGNFDKENAIATDLKKYFISSNSIAGEYEANGSRLTLYEDNSLRYMINGRVHLGSRDLNDDELTLNIEGVNIDNPIKASYEENEINVRADGEMAEAKYKKIKEN